MTQIETSAFRRALERLRDDFVDIGKSFSPVRLCLIHRGDRESDGVGPIPKRFTKFSTGLKAIRRGRRGSGTEQVVRLLILDGDLAATRNLRTRADEAVQVASDMKSELFDFAGQWRIGDLDTLWWIAIFETAWLGRLRLPRQNAKQQLWRQLRSGTIALFERNKEDVNLLDGLARELPAGWMDCFPDAYISEIKDAAIASSNMVGILLDSLASKGKPPAVRWQYVLEKLEQVIAREGAALKPDAVIKAAGLNAKDARRGLRELQRLGKYRGHTRQT